MDDPPYDIAERSALFADRCIEASFAMPDNGVAWELQRQFVRASASIGANLAEAKGVLTKRDFSHKVSLSLKEAHETLFWLRRITNARLIPLESTSGLIGEADELIRILTAILKRARSNE